MAVPHLIATTDSQMDLGLSSSPLLARSPFLQSVNCHLSPASPAVIPLPDLSKCLPPEVSVRDTNLNDAAAVNFIFNETIRFDHVLDVVKEKELSNTQDWIRMLLDRKYPCCVATIRGSVVAFLALEPFAKGYDETNCAMFSARIIAVVAHHFRRRGIASLLWRRVLEHANTAHRQLYLAYVDLLSCNIPAIETAKSWGLTCGGSLPNVALQNGKMHAQLFYSAFISHSPDISDIAFPPPAEDTDIDTSSSEVDTTHDQPQEKLLVREATLADVPAITRITNEVIRNLTAYEWYLPRSEEQTREWLQDEVEADGLFCLVAVMNNRVIGFFALEPYDYGERAVYPYTAQIIVFIEPHSRRRKIGEALYRKALQHPNIAIRKICTLIGDVTTSNTASLNASLKAGFRVAVTVPRLECKFGEWIDSSWVIKQIAPLPGHPA